MTTPRRKVVFVLDDESVRDAFMLALVDDPYYARSFADGEPAIVAAGNMRPDLVVLDLKMAPKNNVETPRELMGIDPSMRVYIVTGSPANTMVRP